MNVYKYPIKGIKIIRPKNKPLSTDIIIGYELVEIQDYNLFKGCLPISKQCQQPVYENIEKLLKNISLYKKSFIYIKNSSFSPINEEIYV